MPGLNESPKYRAFIQDRDRALEKLLNNTHARITDYTSAALRSIESECSFLCFRRDNSSYPQVRILMRQLNENIGKTFETLAVLIQREIAQLLRRSYILASVGEAEAIARATGKGVYKVEGKDAKIPNIEKIQYLLNQSKYKIMRAFEQGLVQEYDSKEIMENVVKSFPKSVRYKRPPKVLKNLKEADKKKINDASSGFITDLEWQDVVDDYLKEHVPHYRTRGPNNVLDIKQDTGEYEERYEWEIEKEANHAFVDQVRSGQNKTAIENGYTDMVWIAILDDRTDECCEWRNGLTSSEIEEKLDGEHSDDECDAIVPPAHFNCRCALAPYTPELGEPEVVDYSDFDTWLKN